MNISANPGRILLVDDEPAILKLLERQLEAHPWELLTATSGEEALAILAREPVDVVLTDDAMPGMSGSRLLTRLRAEYPDVLRILLTGRASVEAAIRAVNEARVFRFLQKPCVAGEIAAAIDEGLERVSRMRRTRSREAAQQTRDVAELEEDLARAQEQLWLAVQPVVSAKTALVHGYEALLRSDASGMENPVTLFEVAGRLGRKIDLSRRVRALAARLCPRLPGECILLVNLNPEDLEDSELLQGLEPLAEHAARVVLEVTERDGLEDEDRLHDRIRTLRELGYRVALDDLGAGYASLNSLAMLTPDFVKFDMSLIREIDRSKTKRRVVEHMLDLCNDLGIRTIAEGIETEEEYDVVRDIGCDYLQGYLFGRPLRAFTEDVPRAA